MMLKELDVTLPEVSGSEKMIYVIYHFDFGEAILVDSNRDRAVERGVAALTGGRQLLDDELSDLEVDSCPLHEVLIPQ